jgi:hypothetical protein
MILTPHLRQDTQPIWLLPVIAGLLPAIATIVAFLISVRLGLIPSCNPFFDGCVSISRTARYDLANLIFRALVLPGATLQALTWIACAQWLRCLDRSGKKTPIAVSILGAFAGGFFVLYGAFLGSEGETYQWLRRYGINFYFGFTYLCMLLVSAQVFQLARGGWIRLRWHLDRGLAVLCLLVMVFGLTNLFSKMLIADLQLVDRLENVLEWIAASIFTLFFAVLALLWNHTCFRLRAACES